MAIIEHEGLGLPFGLKSPNKMYSADMYAGPYDTIKDALDSVPDAIKVNGRQFGLRSSEISGLVESYIFFYNGYEWTGIKNNVPKLKEIFNHWGIQELISEKENDKLIIFKNNGFKNNGIVFDVGDNQLKKGVKISPSIESGVFNFGLESYMFNNDGSEFNPVILGKNNLGLLTKINNSLNTIVSIGNYSLYNLEPINDSIDYNGNTTLGAYSLYNLKYGKNNLSIGYKSGYNLVNGDNNIIIGENSIKNGSNNILIGNVQDIELINDHILLANKNGKLILKTNEVNLTSLPNQTKEAIISDTTGKSIITKEYFDEYASKQNSSEIISPDNSIEIQNGSLKININKQREDFIYETMNEGESIIVNLKTDFIKITEIFVNGLNLPKEFFNVINNKKIEIFDFNDELIHITTENLYVSVFGDVYVNKNYTSSFDVIRSRDNNYIDFKIDNLELTITLNHIQNGTILINTETNIFESSAMVFVNGIKILKSKLKFIDPRSIEIIDKTINVGDIIEVEYLTYLL